MASARPLIAALRQEMPGVVIILSATTRGGQEYGRQLAGLVDCLIPFPLDLTWVVAHFVTVLKPDLFVLVETDFWPNLLARLRRQRVPALLVNGRITTGSMARYQRFRPLFTPLFNSFTRITMQMAADAERLVCLGVAPERIAVCGNLKYDLGLSISGKAVTIDLGGWGVVGRPLLVAGSTHAGEEEILCALFAALRETHPHLAMVIAPRAIARAPAVRAIAVRRGLRCALRSTADGSPCQILVLDTLGELAQVYPHADLAFVGGSLVTQGGHNPLEPAFYGTPVLFGPDMSDFLEISQELCAAGAAKMVTTETILAVVTDILDQEGIRQAMGQAAVALVQTHQGAALRHLGLIRESLSHDQ
jgi:3-deoxy-D-manno-octulosonic-acid transferase